jgi:hypothetical protein
VGIRTVVPFGVDVLVCLQGELHMDTGFSIEEAVRPFFVWACGQDEVVHLRVHGYVDLVDAVTHGRLVVAVNGVLFPDYQVGADAAFCLFFLAASAGYGAAAQVFHELYQCLSECVATPLSLEEVL